MAVDSVGRAVAVAVRRLVRALAAEPAVPLRLVRPAFCALRAGLWLAVAVAIALLPTWLLSRPNPDWPFLNWLLTAEVVAIVLGAVAAIGGRAWLGHFAVPAALIFTAVPWPDVIESPFTQWMMRNVASAAVVLLDVAGVGAIQHGNLIEVATGVVGVDEACSGIRSFQGSLMASLVLGELFRFNISRRVALLVASVVAAFVTNVIRAAFLAWSAAQSGLHAVERWHDPAGMTILLVCVGIILAVALFLDRDAPAAAADVVRRRAHRMAGRHGRRRRALVLRSRTAAGKPVAARRAGPEYAGRNPREGSRSLPLR